MSTEISPLVIDNGSGLIKAGFGGNDAPSYVFPAIVGRPKAAVLAPIDQKICYVGDEAHEKRSLLNLKYPVERGVICNWEDMEKLWHHTFYNELRVDPEEHPILMTEPPLNPKACREKTTQIMFETFNAPAFYISVQAHVGLYATGRTTGMAVDIGDHVCHAVPIYEGYTLPHGIKTLQLGGRDVTDNIMKLLANNKHPVTPDERPIVEAIKHKLCYVAKDWHDEIENIAPTSLTLEKCFSLPGGQLIPIGEERFCGPEILFQPGPSLPGISELTTKAILSCNLDIRRDMYREIVLMGGSSCFPGFAERLEADIRKDAPATSRLKVNAEEPLIRAQMPWLGGSILCSLTTFATMWITKDDYDENGPTVVHRKCF